MYAFLTGLPAFFSKNLLSLASPQAVLELGLPPVMVGRCVALYAPIPRRTTFLAVSTVTFLLGYALLWVDTLVLIIMFVITPSVIGDLDFAVALPFGLTLLPRIRSLFGAGVCAADFGPGLFMIQSIFVGCNKDIVLYL
jgi:hypothetical protein